MSAATDSIEQKCYLEYLISKYTFAQDSNLQKQMLEMQYNTGDILHSTSPVITPTK